MAACMSSLDAQLGRLSLKSLSGLQTVATSAVTILSSEHGLMRRAERLIQKRDLQAAVKHGTREISVNQRGQMNYKYKFADIVYITDETSKREITSWAAPGAGLDLEKVEITSEMQHKHSVAAMQIASRKGWTSHTVIVVDQSGSMRKTDVVGGVTRSDAVWLTLALDFVSKQLTEKTVTAFDVVSVVTMNQNSAVVVDQQPTDWLLYNRIIDLLRSQEPCLDGNYGPALDLAEKLLLKNKDGSCALTLFFLSDGGPSDKCKPGFGGSRSYHSAMVRERIDDLAGRFGRRLSVVAVGFAGPFEDFCVLETMASRPGKFGSSGIFHKASLDAESLGSAFASLVSSVTATKTELTELGGSSQRAVRDVQREAHDTADEHCVSAEWFVYQGVSGRDCYSLDDRKWMRAPLQAHGATGVAYRKKYFGEGAERIVAKIRELNSAGLFVGPLLVAKESRFQLDYTNATDIRVFHKVFCETQGRASKLAVIFNEMLAKIPGVRAATPRIVFLDCSVYTVLDEQYGGDMAFLVEKQLDNTKYKKWNDNRGGIEGRVAPAPVVDIGLGVTDAIAESGEEEESEEEDDDDEGAGNKERGGSTAAPLSAPIYIADADIPQAFSHFTYRHTNRKQLVCDLQGVLSTARDGSRIFELTDPVIHYSSLTGRKNVFGRTDHGKKGIHNFFKTHVCTDLCRMLNKTWVRRTEGGSAGGGGDGGSAGRW